MTIQSVLRICLPATALLALLPAGAQSATPATGQTAPAQPAGQTPGPVVASAVGAISLPVTVVDDKGNPVKNVAAADLKLTDNGEAQTIQSLTPAAPTPVAFGIVGQTSTGLRTELGDERLSSVHFVDHTLPGTQDQFFVVDYASEVDLLADPTTTATKLHDAINQMGSPQFGSQNGGSDTSDQSSANTHGSGVGGTLYDAIYLAATEELKKLPGQHVIVLFSDGIDHDSKETMSDAIQAAQSAHVAIFAIYYKSEEQQQNPNQNNRHGGMGGNFPGGGTGGGYPGGGGGRRGGENPTEQPHEDGRQNLIHICNATGGYMVEGKRDKGDEAYNKLAALLKSQYTLTFVPSKAAQDSDFQRISLTTEKKGVYPLVQEGYTPQQ
jgi:VWFA-related protein